MASTGLVAGVMRDELEFFLDRKRLISQFYPMQSANSTLFNL